MRKRIVSLIFFTAMMVLSVSLPAQCASEAPVRFYNPNGGSYAHRNPYCTRVDRRFLPLEEVGARGEGDAVLRRLQTCPACGDAPVQKKLPDSRP